MNIFEIVYWAAILMEIVIRYPYRKTWKEGAKTDQRVSRVETTLLGLLTVFMFLLPLLYSATNWLESFNYSLPAWLGWLGVALMICCLLVFWRAHIDLKSNWSPTLEIRKDHSLITAGIYGYIRHPMYASQWLWVIAQILLLQNWLAGPLNLLFFIPFYWLRVRAEEKMMRDTFGGDYDKYVQNTGGVIPKSLKPYA